MANTIGYHGPFSYQRWHCCREREMARSAVTPSFDLSGINVCEFIKSAYSKGKSLKQNAKQKENRKNNQFVAVNLQLHDFSVCQQLAAEAAHVRALILCILPVRQYFDW